MVPSNLTILSILLFKVLVTVKITHKYTPGVYFGDLGANYCFCG